MNISDKIIDEQGPTSTFSSGADSRLIYRNVDGQEKKYLIEGEGGGGSSTVSGLTNEFGTYVKSQTNNAKQLSNIVIDPCKPTNGNAMNLFIKANGNEVISIQNNNISTSVISIGRYNDNSSNVPCVGTTLKINDLHIQYKKFVFFDNFSITNEVLSSEEYSGFTADQNFLKFKKVEGILDEASPDEDNCIYNFKEDAQISKNDYDEVLYFKNFDFTSGSKGIRLKFYVNGSELDDNKTIGLKLIKILKEEDPEGNPYWEEYENSTIFDGGIVGTSETIFFNYFGNN